MKKIFSLIIAATLLLSLCSCGGYVSSYKAIGLVRSQTKHGCETIVVLDSAQNYGSLMPCISDFQALEVFRG